MCWHGGPRRGSARLLHAAAWLGSGAGGERATPRERQIAASPHAGIHTASKMPIFHLCSGTFQRGSASQGLYVAAPERGFVVQLISAVWAKVSRFLLLDCLCESMLVVKNAQQHLGRAAVAVERPYASGFPDYCRRLPRCPRLDPTGCGPPAADN